VVRKLYKSLSAYVHRPFASIIFAFLFFIEAIFFIPVDPILIMFCLERRSQSLFYAAVATLSSVLGGFMAYLIGSTLFDTLGLRIINIFSSMETFNRITNLYRSYESYAVLFSSFTPFPYKIVTLSAGFCKLPLIPFITCSLIGRGARFFLVAYIIKKHGAQVQQFIDRYFNYLVIIFTLFILLCMVFLK